MTEQQWREFVGTWRTELEAAYNGHVLHADFFEHFAGSLRTFRTYVSRWGLTTG